jgi:hypothetical protein
MILIIVAYIPAVFLGAVLGVTLMSGKALSLRALWPPPLRGPEVVNRLGRPREYWATVFSTGVCFAFALWWAIGFSG